MFNNILDTRVLKKFGIYLAMAIGGYGGLLAFFLGCMWLSYHYFDSPVPFVLSLFGMLALAGIFMMANERVKSERIKEQHELDYIAAKLKADEEHQQWRQDFHAKFGVWPENNMS